MNTSESKTLSTCLLYGTGLFPYYQYPSLRILGLPDKVSVGSYLLHDRLLLVVRLTYHLPFRLLTVNTDVQVESTTLRQTG